ATFPAEIATKLRVIPEGVDTTLYRRRTGVPRRLPDGTPIDPDTRIVTYVSRGFELTRGFDGFMAAAKRIHQQFPRVVFVVVGTDRAHYGPDRALTRGEGLRQRLLATGEFDLSRFHFTGWLPEDKLIDVLSMSDLHIYLTAPF